MSNELSLYNLEQEHMALVDTEPFVSPEQEQEFRAALASSLKQVVEKRDRVASFLLYCQSQQDNIAAEISRLNALKKRYEAAENRMSQYVVSVIESYGTDAKGKYQKLQGNVTTLRVQKNPDTVKVLDDATIPACYKTLTITVPANVWELHLQRYDEMRELLSDLIEGPKFEAPAVTAAIKKTEVSIDKKQLLKDLKADVVVPGADVEFGKNRICID